MDDAVRLDRAIPPQAQLRAGFTYVPADPGHAPALSIATRYDAEDPAFPAIARSILQQSFQQWEWLIVCYAAHHAVDALRQRYGADDPRVRVIDVPAGADVRAAIHAAATARYILDVPPGSILEPAAAEKLLWFLATRTNVGAVGGWSLALAEGELVRPELPDSRAFLEKKHPASMNGSGLSVRATVPEYLEVQCSADVGAEAIDLSQLRTTWPDLPPASARAALGPGFEREQATDVVPQEPPFHNRLVKARPRILLIASWLTSREVDTWNLDLVAGLCAAGWDVSIATTREGDDEWLPTFAAHTPDIFLLHRFLRPSDYPHFLRYLIESRGIDVVLIAHSELAYLLLPYLRAYSPDTAFLDYCLSEDEFWRNGGFPALSVQWRALLDGSITSSEHLRSWMVGRGADPARVAVAPPNVDTAAWQPDAALRASVRGELGVSERMPLLLYPGRISAQQRPQVFARVMQNLARKRLDFVALVAGDGPDLPWLRTFIEREGLARHVRLLGLVAHDDLKDLIAAADIVFLPSHGEGVGLTAFQAMASAVAVVGTAVGGSTEIVTPECGVLIERGTEDREVKAYTTALASVMAKPVRMRAMGRAARERAERQFRIEQMHHNMLTLLLEGMRRHRTAPQPAPDPEVAQSAAQHGVEHIRLLREAELRRVRPAAPGAAAQIRRALDRLLRRHRAPTEPSSGNRQPTSP